MTGKLFYKDVYLTSFETTIIKRDYDESHSPYVLLNETAFYPTGGGQPHDTGKINNINVLDVVEVDGELRHYVESLPLHENKALCCINWERRFDHMQQHAGQHILSAAFENTFGYKTISFHLGKEICTIDLEISDINEIEINQIEAECNSIIRGNKPIITKWVTEEELSEYTLRKELSVRDHIRLVIIPDFDYNGCGGTHPKSTGEIGCLKIVSWEKHKSHIRIQFVCGDRVLGLLQEKNKVIMELTSILNAPQENMIEAADRLLANNKELHNKNEELKSQLIKFEAKNLSGEGQLINGVKLISSIYNNRSIKELQNIAREVVTKENDHIVILISDHQDKFQLVIARSEEVTLNLQFVINEVLPAINGKGGGKPSFVQGGGEKLITAADLLQRFVNVITN